ncbi:hypothetical protein H5768_11615 [Klebsiella pneumoniae]|uniref:hypothetical protein n=1 Tax=Klebsiella pneumoniae TaxID=573 RepID=UPI0003DE147D|nr:hypothetical protein [Klebsiella pneumoniae]MBZ6649187.1 hypothetical protein [Klebsiella pneumoniae]MCB3761194.1 hypothetical protein [Klebsiella pneumoniae]MDG5060862.1 hypothetical protein [Klebsiella pneumoniae]TNA83130.1 hypothetical protein EME57_05165 [Klebsiella pneumoniae]UDC75662.1 hypothetical protein LGM08_20430 [Klebsiella pneumoniae]
MNIETVNELIASLESAGELSIREQKFLKLAKAFKQLEAENVALKNAITDHSHSVHFCEVCGKDDPCSTDDVCYALKDIPATDAYLSRIKADGVEEFVRRLRQHVDEGDFVGDEVAVIVGAIDCGKEFFEQLREGANHD